MRFITILSLTVIFLLLFSCNNDNNSISLPAQVAVAISVTLPEPEEVQTRAYTDKEIKNLTVLVFDHTNKFMERIDVDASDLVSTGTGTKFSIILDATAENRTLHLIANARMDDAGLADRIDFTGLSTTQTEAVIMPALTTKAITSTGSDALLNGITPLIMWGRVALSGVTITTTVDQVKLLRSVACVQVKKATSGNGLSDLTLSQLAIHNGAGQGYVTSSAYSSAVISTPTTGHPYAVAAFDYSKAWSEASSEPLAYIYEGNYTAGNYMSVILSATYNGQAGYYRIVLSDSNNAPVNILRNHRYTINILSVNGAGYANVATAAGSAPANNDLMKVQITIDDTSVYPFMKSDSQYWIGMTNNICQLIGSGAGSTTSGVELCTVYSSRGIAPVVTNLPAGLTTTVTGSGNIYKVAGTFTNGLSFGNHTVTVSCDNLSLPLEVQWTNSITSYAGSASDADSYVLDLSGGLSNWKVWIPAPATNSMVHLHPTNSQPGALTANVGSGMLTELLADYFGHAYLHIHKSTNRQDVVWTSAHSNGTVMARKTIIAQ